MLSVFNLTHFDGFLLEKKKKKGQVITVNVIKASTSKVLLFFISQCLNGTFSFIQQSTVESNRKC